MYVPRRTDPAHSSAGSTANTTAVCRVYLEIMTNCVLFRLSV
jgi:hypothetical protein